MGMTTIDEMRNYIWKFFLVFAEGKTTKDRRDICSTKYDENEQGIGLSTRTLRGD